MIIRFFSRDVAVLLFCLYWILFPEMSQVAISSLLEDVVSSPPVLTRGLLKFCWIKTVQFQKELLEEELDGFCLNELLPQIGLKKSNLDYFRLSIFN